MSNPLINNGQNIRSFSNIPDYRALYNDFSKNPMETFLKMKYNIPANVGNTPAEIGQYLLNSGQIPQQVINTAMNMLNPFMAWLNGK